MKVPLLVSVTITGTSPAPANEAGSVMVIKSSPNMLTFLLTVDEVIAVVPRVTDTSLGMAPRTPVKWISSTVGTWVPVLSAEVTLKGSITHPETAVLVTLQMIARPPAACVVEKMSGCAATIFRVPRITVPLLLITNVATPADKPIGTTKSISLDAFPTKYKPAAAPLMETETPFSSIGNIGLRAVSDPPTPALSDGARATDERTMLNSPGASPPAIVPGVGVGVGLGEGLAAGGASSTGKVLAPVKKDKVAADNSVTTVGLSR